VGLNGCEIYRSIGEKMKRVDFTRLKREKMFERNDKIDEYQSILRKIESLHIQMEEQDLQHESHLLTQYRMSREGFWMSGAACFGIKRAHALVIKNFSWKNSV
jgi:hypothetical protein